MADAGENRPGVQLFGMSGAELIPFLNQGATAAMSSPPKSGAWRADEYETAAQAGNFNDALDKLKLAPQHRNQIIASCCPP
jgi:hypothetical protein